jgi:hypothetical protein
MTCAVLPAAVSEEDGGAMFGNSIEAVGASGSLGSVGS